MILRFPCRKPEKLFRWLVIAQAATDREGTIQQQREINKYGVRVSTALLRIFTVRRIAGVDRDSYNTMLNMSD